MRELQHVVCPVDFSDATAPGVRAAADIAEAYGADLLLAHVLHHPLTETLGLDLAALGERARAEAQRRLEALAATLRDRTIPVRTRLEKGAPFHEIAALAERLAADLIVIPTHGRGALEMLALGSVAERVVRTATCPVMTLPPVALDDRFAPKRVLVATDFSDVSDHVQSQATMLAARYDADLVIVHVLGLGGAEGADWILSMLPREHLDDAMAEAEGRLRERAARARDAGVRTVTVLKEAGSPAHQIAETADEEGVDVVVVGSQGESRLLHALIGSTTEKLVRTCRRPLLTIPPLQRERPRLRAPATMPVG